MKPSRRRKAFHAQPRKTVVYGSLTVLGLDFLLTALMFN